MAKSFSEIWYIYDIIQIGRKCILKATITAQGYPKYYKNMQFFLFFLAFCNLQGCRRLINFNQKWLNLFMRSGTYITSFKLFSFSLSELSLLKFKFYMICHDVIWTVKTPVVQMVSIPFSWWSGFESQLVWNIIKNIMTYHINIWKRLELQWEQSFKMSLFF